MFEVEVIGRQNIPKKGGVILAANHQAVLDSFAVSVAVRRRVTFLAKSEYFTGRGPIGWLMKKFFSVGALPVYRGSREAGEMTAVAMSGVLKAGGAVGIHPEGTRAPDEHVYKGQRSLFAVVWDTHVPVVPVALLGTRQTARSGRRHRRKITVIFGEPMIFTAPTPLPTPPRLPMLTDMVGRAQATHVQKAQARMLMEEIARLGGFTYIDKDAGAVKAAALKASKPR